LVRDVICASSLRASSVPRENILRINRVIKDISSTNSSSSLPGGETQESRNEETLQFSGIVSYNENLKPFDVGLKGNVCMQILQYLFHSMRFWRCMPTTKLPSSCPIEAPIEEASKNEEERRFMDYIRLNTWYDENDIE